MVFSLSNSKETDKIPLKANVVPRQGEKYIPKIVSKFLGYFDTNLPNGKKSEKPVSLLDRMSMYMNVLNENIKLMQSKCQTSDNEYEKIQYRTAVSVLNGEMEIHKYLYEKIEQQSLDGDVPELPEERMKGYMTLAMTFWQQYKLSGCKEAKHRSKGMDEAIDILYKVRQDTEVCNDDSMKRKSTKRSFWNRVLTWAFK